MDYKEVIEQRRSIKSYDPDKTISEAELKELFEEVILSPSSFNLQHWLFIAVTDPGQKSRLKDAAFGQQQVESCSAAVVVCGKLDAYRDVSSDRIQGFYEGKDQLIRDEAIRSASLAAMTLMYSAKNRGYDSGPMIGFNPEAVIELVKIPENYIPVMLVVIGPIQDKPGPRGLRKPVKEVVKLNSFDGPGLA
ncbi:MAG: nitroreductase family protein [Planctomycetota bacterium]|nr:nitroreductase family protein [Planctomycetota bacterium]MDA1138718.1 nitroreductase family protein [Planctomycetota bacterium]